MAGLLRCSGSNVSSSALASMRHAGHCTLRILHRGTIFWYQLHSLREALLLLYVGFASGLVRNASASQAVTNDAVPQASIVSRQIRLPMVDRANIRFERFYSVEGPSKSNVGPFVQDDQGFMWFGTPHGLNRFDGYTFKVFTHDPKNARSISGPFIHALFKDHTGTLWVGCNEFLNKFDSATETFT